MSGRFAAGDPGTDLISVILPVHNGEKYLSYAIQSILGQTYDNFELILIDDGSTDDSLAIARRFASTDGRVRLVTHENRGLIATLNEGLALARGDLVARMDADDIAYPQRLQLQAEAFRNRPDLALCGTYYDLLGRRGRLRKIVNVPFCESDDLAVLSWFFCMLKHPTVMFCRSRIDPAALHYDPQYPHAEDFDLFRRIAAAHPVHLIDRPLLAYREHPESVSSLKRREQHRTHLRIVEENLSAAAIPVNVSPLHAIFEQPDDAAVRDAGSVIFELDRFGRSLDPHRAEVFAEGLTNLFFFIFSILRKEEEPALLFRYVQASGRLGGIRRSEKLLLQHFGRFGRFAKGALGLVEEAHFAAGDLASKSPKAIPGWDALR